MATLSAGGGMMMQSPFGVGMMAALLGTWRKRAMGIAAIPSREKAHRRKSTLIWCGSAGEISSRGTNLFCAVSPPSSQEDSWCCVNTW